MLMDKLEEHISRVLKGDQASYTYVVDACEPRVRAVIAAMCPDPNVVADLTQETFIIAYQRIDSYKPGTNFLAWLRTIARNVTQNERRKWYRRRDMEERYRSEVEQTIESAVDDLVDTLPEDMIEALTSCIENLKGRTRSLVDGFYFDEESVKELAKQLDLTANAAKVTLHRARNALGNCMKSKGTCDV